MGKAKKSSDQTQQGTRKSPRDTKPAAIKDPATIASQPKKSQVKTPNPVKKVSAPVPKKAKTAVVKQPTVLTPAEQAEIAEAVAELEAAKAELANMKVVTASIIEINATEEEEKIKVMENQVKTLTEDSNKLTALKEEKSNVVEHIKEMENAIQLQRNLDSHRQLKNHFGKLVADKIVQGWQRCEICQVRYEANEKKTPRLLHCGHTMCLECAEKRITNDGIICPLDGLKSNEKGKPAKQTVSKNFTVQNMCGI